MKCGGCSLGNLNSPPETDRLTDNMESSLLQIAVIFCAQLTQQSRSLDFPAQRLKLDGLPHLLSRAGGTDWFLDPANIP
jgi:hypothetical protein